MPPNPARSDAARSAVARRDDAGVATTTKPTLTQLIKAQQAEIARALPKHISPERFLRAVLTVCRTTPKLLDCSPESMLGAMMLSAQLGLEPGPLGHAYYVPFWNNKAQCNEVQFIPGYKGLIDLARRGGHVASIRAHAVFDGDEFTYGYGLEPELIHKPTAPNCDRVNPLQIIAVYAVARFVEPHAEPLFVVLTRAQVEGYRKRSKAATNGPWVSDWEAMALKTAVRRLCTWLPLSVEVATALDADGRVVHNVTNGGEGLVIDLGPDDVEDVPSAAALEAGDGDNGGPAEDDGASAGPATNEQGSLA